ncbi:MAG: HIT domain-containing protein [Candidatus Niyogibacteria bacterium]|nr:HIT domain-containing protein [Candidatus Niyogibacteria bacterium]
MDKCIFCRIADKKEKADIVFENDEFVVFKNIKQDQRVHLLMVPKKHIHSVADLEDDDAGLMGRLILTARDIAEKEKLSGYKLLFNVGRDGGQIIDHIHLHLLAD